MFPKSCWGSRIHTIPSGGFSVVTLKTTAPLTASRDTLQPSACPLPRVNVTRGSICGAGVKHRQAPLVAAVGAHTLVALSACALLWNEDRAQGWSHCRSCPPCPLCPHKVCTSFTQCIKHRNPGSKNQAHRSNPDPCLLGGLMGSHASCWVELCFRTMPQVGSRMEKHAAPSLTCCLLNGNGSLGEMQVSQ